MPEIVKKLLTWIDAVLDPQPAAEPEIEEVEPIDFREFFTDPLYPHDPDRRSGPEGARTE